MHLVRRTASGWLALLRFCFASWLNHEAKGGGLTDLAVGFNGQIRKGTPFSLDSALHLGEVCAGRTALGFSPVVVRTHILRSARASTGTGVRDICRGQETLQRSRDGAPPID